MSQEYFLHIHIESYIDACDIVFDMKKQKFIIPCLQYIYLVVISFLSLMIVLDLNSIKEANAQYFVQKVNVHIDKGQYTLGNYGVILRDTFTNDEAINYYNDFVSSPQDVVTSGYVKSYDGDNLQACVMKMSTNQISCAFGEANRSFPSLDIYVSMNDAVMINPG